MTEPQFIRAQAGDKTLCINLSSISRIQINNGKSVWIYLSGRNDADSPIQLEGSDASVFLIRLAGMKTVDGFGVQELGNIPGWSLSDDSPPS